jgi:hypothetical protein
MPALCHLDHRRTKKSWVRRDGMAANKVTAVRMGILAVSSRCQANWGRRAKGVGGSFSCDHLLEKGHRLRLAHYFWPRHWLERISDIAAAPELMERCRDVGNDSCWRPRTTIWKALTWSSAGP